MLFVERVRWQLTGLGLLLGLAGCRGEEPACVLLDSSFEQFEGWQVPRPPELNEERAHSGRYSLRLADGAEYGAAYHTLLDRCTAPPRRVRLSAWVYFPSGRIGSTNLVLEVNCHGRRPNVWQAFDVEQVVKRFRKWEPVQKLYHLPADLQPSDELKLYVWHGERGGENIWLDDMRLEAE